LGEIHTFWYICHCWICFFLLKFQICVSPVNSLWYIHFCLKHVTALLLWGKIAFYFNFLLDKTLIYICERQKKFYSGITVGKFSWIFFFSRIKLKFKILYKGRDTLLKHIFLLLPFSTMPKLYSFNFIFFIYTLSRHIKTQHHLTKYSIDNKYCIILTLLQYLMLFTSRWTSDFCRLETSADISNLSSLSRKC